MNSFNPTLIKDPRMHKAAADAVPQSAPPASPMPVVPVPPVAAVPVPPVMQPVFIPMPIKTPPVEKKDSGVSIAVARKAQGIYPKEQQAKQRMIENAKAPPTPTGAWGAPA